MSTSSQTLDEFAESLTGYEEISIAKHFEHELAHLAEHKPTMSIRALIMVDQARDGAKAADAVKFAMSLKLSEVMDYFRDDSEDEIDPVDLETATGKGDVHAA